MSGWFVHPELLLIALAALIPWWLARRAKTEPVVVPWGAMRWLEGAMRSAQRAPRRRWRTAFLRSLLLVAVAAAVAIPRTSELPALGPWSRAEPRTWWILVIDDGPQSTYVPREVPLVGPPRARLDQAIAEAEAILLEAPPSDAFSLVSATAPLPQRSVEPSVDRDALRRRLAGWRSTPYVGDLDGTIAALAEQFDRLGDSGRPYDRIELIVWSHRRSAAWTGNTELPPRLTPQRLGKLGAVRLRDWGTVTDGNVAVTDISGVGGPKFPGETFPVWVTVVNRDPTRPALGTLRWRVDDRPRGERPFELEPGERQRIRIELAAPEVGRHAIACSIDTDPLPLDSTCWEAFEVIDRLELRLWSRDEREIDAFRAWAAARSIAGRETVVRVGGPTSDEPTAVGQVVRVIGTIDEPTDAQRDELRRRLEAGEGLIVACGAERSPEFWERLIDVPLGSWRPTAAADESTRVADDPPDGFRIFEPDDPTLAATPIWRQWERVEPWPGEWRVAMHRGEQPLVALRRVGRGTLALLTTGWGAVEPEQLGATDETPNVWSALAWWPSFPPLLLRSIDSVQAGLPRERTTFGRLSRREAAERTPKFRTVLGADLGTARSPSNDRNQDEIADTEAPGIDELPTASGGTRWIVRNLAPDATALGTSVFATGWSEVGSPLGNGTSDDPRRDRADIATFLALALIGLVLLEGVMTRREPNGRLPQRTTRESQGIEGTPPTFGLAIANPLLAQTSELPVTSRLLPTWEGFPWLALLLAAAIGAALAWMARHETLTSRRRAARGLRWLTLFSLAVAAGGWIERPTIETPTRVALLVDLSASMSLPDDERLLSAERSNGNVSSGPTRLERVVGPLRSTDDWPARWGTERAPEWYVFGDSLERLESWPELLAATETPDRTETSLGQIVRELSDEQGSPGPSAIVLVSDGVATDGLPPSAWEESLRQSGIPWFPVRPSEFVRRPRIELQVEPAPEVLVVGETLLSRATIRSSTPLDVPIIVRWIDSESGRTLAQVDRASVVDPGTLEYQASIDVDRPGQLRWEVQALDPRDDSSLGPSRTIRFEAREQIPEVLLVAGEPSSEYRYLKHALERATNPHTAAAAFAVTCRLQSADFGFERTDRSATETFPTTDEELARFDVIVLLDPILSAQDPARGLTTDDLDRLRRAVADDAANLIVVAGPATDFRPWRGSPLEPLLPCRIEDLIRVDATSGEREPLRLEPTPLGLATAPLRFSNRATDVEREGGIERPSSVTDSYRPQLSFLLGVSRLRPGTRPLLALSPSDGFDVPPIGLVLQPFGRGEVLYQGFDEAYRLRQRAPDDRSSRYWVQWIRQLARHRWLDRHRGPRLSVDREEVRVGDSIGIVVTSAGSPDGIAPSIEVLGPDGSRGTIVADEFAGEASRQAARFDARVPGRHQARLIGSEEGEGVAVDFDVLPERTESDPVPADIGRLERIAELSGGRLIDASQLLSPADWLPAVERSRRSAGDDRPIWLRRSVPLLFGLWIVVLLVTEWWLRGD